MTAAIGKVVEREAFLPGAHLEVCRKRADGFTRVELRVYSMAERVVLYMTDDERRKFAEAIWPKERP